MAFGDVERFIEVYSPTVSCACNLLSALIPVAHVLGVEALGGHRERAGVGGVLWVAVALNTPEKWQTLNIRNAYNSVYNSMYL